MYSSIYELPSQVQACFDKNDQKVWMDTFNKANAKTEADIRKARVDAWKACMELPSSFSFKIIASADDLDKDKEIIDLSSLKKHMDDFIDHNGNLMAEHKNYCVGHIFAWEPIKKNGMDAVLVYGNLFGGDDPVYKSVRKSFLKGRNNLSVAGESEKSHFECDDRGCYTRRFVKSLQEISLCFTPANKHCVLQWSNPHTDFAKSAKPKDDVELGIMEMTFHKSYDECPILKLRKSLRDHGIEAHARQDGVFVAMSEDSFNKSLSTSDDAWLCADWMDGGVLLRDKDDVIEKTYRDGYAKGYLDKDGVFTDDADFDFFCKAVDYGIVDRVGDDYIIIDPSNSQLFG